MIKCNYVYYPRPYYFILPTIIFNIFDRFDGDVKWTIDFRWLRFMITIAKFNKK